MPYSAYLVKTVFKSEKARKHFSYFYYFGKHIFVLSFWYFKRNSNHIGLDRTLRGLIKWPKSGFQYKFSTYSKN